jgi:predicted flap endonuclease-1-like 5' DNA nuclease
MYSYKAILLQAQSAGSNSSLLLLLLLPAAMLSGYLLHRFFNKKRIQAASMSLQQPIELSADMESALSYPNHHTTFSTPAGYNGTEQVLTEAGSNSALQQSKQNAVEIALLKQRLNQLEAGNNLLLSDIKDTRSAEPEWSAMEKELLLLTRRNAALEARQEQLETQLTAALEYSPPRVPEYPEKDHEAAVQLADVAAANQQLLSDIKDLEAENIRLAKALMLAETLTENHDRLVAENTALRQDLDELASVRSRLETGATDLETLRSQLEEAENINRQMRSELSANNVRAAQQDTYQQEIKLLQSKFDALNNSHQRLRMELDEAVYAKTQLETGQIEATQWQSRFNELDGAYHQLRMELDNTRNTLHHIENERNGLMSHLAGFSQLQSENNELKAQLAEFIRRNGFPHDNGDGQEALRAKINALEEELKVIQSIAEEWQQMHETVSAENEELKEAAAQAKRLAVEPAIVQEKPPVKNHQPAGLVEPSPEADDLKLIEGIGPRIEAILNKAGIYTYSRLADTSPTVIQLLLNAAGQTAKTNTWPRQSALAAAGKWNELKQLQDGLVA